MAAAALEVIHDPTRAASLFNPVRLRLLKELVEPDSAAGLARRLRLPRQAVTYHVRQLETDGLVSLVEERRRRNCVERVVQATARSYVISPTALGALGVSPEHVKDRLSSNYLIAVAGRIIQDVGRLRQQAGRTDERLGTLTLQSDVCFASPADQLGFATELASAVASLAMKYHREPAPGGQRFSIAITGYPILEKTEKIRKEKYAVPALR
jgi:DNA-binding transcriptional ArsR family regulator